jgi:hypothetical protein
VVGDDQLAVVRGDGREDAGARAVTAPDALDERRVRRAVLDHEEAHTYTTNGGG